jgi:alpha-1,2-mannosyltransferase
VLLAHAAIIHPPHMGDLAVYRTAGDQVLEGKMVYAKVPPNQIVSLGRSYLVFTYPPFAAIIAVPLALMPWRVAEIAWVPLVYGPLLVTIWFAFRPLLARTGRYLVATLGGCLAVCMFLWPMLQEIRFGQVDIALAALCVADLAVAKPKWPRGLLIGLATAIKLMPGVFIIYLLLTGRRKAAAVSAATAIGCSLIAWVLIPGNSTYYWTSALFNIGRLGRPGQTSDQSIRAMMLRAFAPTPAPGALWLVIAMIVAVAGFAAARTAARRGNEMAGVAIVGMLSVLVSPVSWIHHIVWIVVAIGAVVANGRSTWRWLVAVGTAEFFIFFDPYATRTPWIASAAASVFQQVRQDSFGIACAALMVVLALLPGPPRQTSQRSPTAPDRQSNPPLQPALAHGYSTASGESGSAAQPQPLLHAGQPDPR